MASPSPRSAAEPQPHTANRISLVGDALSVEGTTPSDNTAARTTPVVDDSATEKLSSDSVEQAEDEPLPHKRPRQESDAKGNTKPRSLETIAEGQPQGGNKRRRLSAGPDTNGGAEVRVQSPSAAAATKAALAPPPCLPPPATRVNLADLIREEIEDFYESFPGLATKYKIINKIGEGTFSSVYQAIDLEHEQYQNDSWEPQMNAQAGSPPCVALKRIYVTSSPQRIYSEIQILNYLSGHPNIVQLVTAVRHEDQVVVVLPFFRHPDFREYFLDLTMDQIRQYMRALLRALEHVHKHRVLHRDVKPSNFLYDPMLGTGVLCDFGLAQKEESREHRHSHADGTSKSNAFPARTRDRPPGYVLNDPRPSVRASRAGTRGFRAPEVLLKVVNQTCAIDVWSAGVMLLCLFTGRFPFFEANDDQEAFLEIGHVFGKATMKEVALQLDRKLDTNIPAVDKPIPFEELCQKMHSKRAQEIPPEGFDLLRRLLAPHPRDRITAKEACRHPFLSSH
ncbi:hypothetical protein HDU87_007891 [Geranomyces variabilis]|uniref:non-specific serine/threonine protein kinase n=1 Tax=Geranomyces variabilis TaxID=109894 RepID=A0AAD5TD92_9FUNG|nr:hypothetical protein HDU87_007891 [Geranomyces variabilis]